MDQDIETLLYPYVTTPRRVALDAVAALEGCPAVARVVLFGSLTPLRGEPRNDGYADVDLLAHVEGEDGAWQAAAALRRAIPLRWHGRFEDRAAPSGRHWPLGEGPFHSIDLSFVGREEFDAALHAGADDPTARRDIVIDRAGVASAGRPELAVCSNDYEFTHALNMATNAMKAYLRASGAWDDLAAAMKNLEAAFRTLVRRPAGAEPEDVLNEMRTLYFALMNERLRYGGDG